jgi:predicted RND superfamily exporter protein
VIGWVLERPGRVLLAALTLTVVLGFAASHIRFDNTPDTWLPTVGEDLADYERFRERFGDDSLIVAFGAAAKPGEPAWRQALGELGGTLRGIPGVRAVDVPFQETGGAPPTPLAQRLERGDGRPFGLAMFPEEGLDAAERSRLVARIEEALEAAPGVLGELRLAGADVITHDLDVGSQRSLGGLAPLVFALMCAVFFQATRSARAVGAMLAAVIAGCVWTLGLVGAAGRTLNLIVAVMPAIIAVVTCAQATHLLSRFQSLETWDGDASDRAQRVAWWRQAIEACWRPCLLSAVTTAAGFAALAVSEIPPVRDLGLFTAAGVLFSFVLTFSVVPALLVASPRVQPRARPARWWTPERAGALAARLRRHAPAITAAGLAAVLLCAAGIGRLTLESHILEFFPPDHRIPVNYRAVEESLLALTPVELVLEGEREALLDPATVDAFDAWIAQVRAAEPLLEQVLSPLGDEASTAPAAVRAAGLRAAIPADGQPLPQALERYVAVEGERVVLRTTLAARTSSSNACNALVQRLRAALDGAFPEALDAHITGGATLLIHGQVLLLDTQVRSFAVAFALITGVIALVFRSGPLLAISLLPNLMPIVLTLGLMGLLGVPLDTATVTVAGIALGLIVDDTIHFLHEYGHARRRGAGAGEAVSRTLFIVGRPVLVTSVAVAVGFGAFAFSEFRPTLYFGLLIAWTSLAAVVCDLLVLPALLQLRGLPGRARASATALALLVACGGALGCVGPSGPPATPVNLHEGVALHGYDPVAYFTEGRPRPGDPRFEARLDGARYRFASEEHRRLFEADPQRYTPEYGGYCAYAVSVNRTADIDPRFWSIADGRLFLNAGRLAQMLWSFDEPGRIRAADRNWARFRSRLGDEPAAGPAGAAPAP